MSAVQAKWILSNLVKFFHYSLCPKHLKQKQAGIEHSEKNLNSQALILNYDGVAKLKQWRRDLHSLTCCGQTKRNDSSLNQIFGFLLGNEIFKLCTKTTCTFRLMQHFTLLITWKYSILSSSGKSSNPYARSSQDSNSSAKVFHLRQYATTSSNILCTQRSSIDTFFQRSPVSRIKRSMLTLSRWSEIHITYSLSVINNNVSCRWQTYLLCSCAEHGHIFW